MATLILTGDVNLKGVTDPAVPLARVNAELRKGDLVFCNLECLLGVPPADHSHSNEGFFVDPDVGAKVLTDAGIGVVGIANNVHYGEPINTSIAQLDRIGILHTGAGKNLAAARAPAIVERAGVRFGFVQRSSIYWPTNHEARKDAVGIAVIKGHTAYQIPTSRLTPNSYPPNRPGLPPQIVTWTDAAYLAEFKEDIAALRPQVDVLVASCHWGVDHDVLQYMTEIAHDRDRCRRRHRGRAWAALCAADRSLQEQTDLLQPLQSVVPLRPSRRARRLDRAAGVHYAATGQTRGRDVSAHAPQRQERDVHHTAG